MAWNEPCKVCGKRNQIYTHTDDEGEVCNLCWHDNPKYANYVFCKAHESGYDCGYRIPKGGSKYCKKCQARYKCKECGEELTADHYSVNIGDETERKWDKNKFKLCPSCWSKKKEGYKSSVGKYNGVNWEDKKIEVWKMKRGGMEKLGNCQTCKKWDDEYDMTGRYDNYCSLECEKNKGKGNDDKRERERERERERDKNNNYFNGYKN